LFQFTCSITHNLTHAQHAHVYHDQPRLSLTAVG
jgi:hypothetical protein